MSISERLQMVIKMNGMTNASFADKIGVQRSSISHVLAGRNKPSIDFIQKILNAFPKVDADWLIIGKKVGRLADSNEVQPTSQSIGEVEEEKILTDTNPVLKDDDIPVYKGSRAQDSEYTQSKTSNNEQLQRKVSKIIVFYDDGTFQELPSTD
ncbi:MAG TPA: helix-turn-helix transcriptional regulator [Brumimicrobium sp.]|nr:helix-turn-helix transcriptional regulator [Brumimicrobium sp.]